VKPDAVARAERLLGGEAESWRRVESRGWSRNEHWTLVLRDGTRAFLKEASIAPSPEWLRREAEVLRLVRGPFAPKLLAFEDGGRPLLVLDDLSEGSHWPPPWRPGDVEAVLGTLEEAARTRVDGLPRFESWPGWHAVADDPAPFLSLRIASGAWLERALPELLAAQDGAGTAGDALVHFDVRSDNLCIRDSRAVLVDWNHACLGNPELDVACWLPSLVLEGGPGPREVGRGDELAALVAGFFAALAGLPPPEGAPRVRGFQIAQLEVALPWACDVLGLEPPDQLR
jgi:Phosphotransferase enzyme family